MRGGGRQGHDATLSFANFLNTFSFSHEVRVFQFS